MEGRRRAGLCVYGELIVIVHVETDCAAYLYHHHTYMHLASYIDRWALSIELYNIMYEVRNNKNNNINSSERTLRCFMHYLFIYFGGH